MAGRPSFVTGLLLLLLAGLAPAARGQFDAFTWTLVDPDPKTSGNYVAGDEMHIECFQIGFATCDTHYEAVAPASGTFVVDVDSCVIGVLPSDGAYTYRNGFKKKICSGHCSTTATLDVEAGDTFGFGIAGNDFICAYATFTNLRFVAKPVVHSISPTLAFLQEDVVITGEGFDADTTVVVDGAPQTVRSWTPTQLVIAPGPHAPGRFDVRVTNAGTSTTKLPGGLAYLPTLDVSGAELGRTLSIATDSGTPGAYLLFFGLYGLPAPLPAASAYYGLLIDPSAAFGILVTGALSGTAPAELSFTLPDLPALSGTPFHMQALVQQGGAPGGVTASFTNRTSHVLLYPTTSTLHVLEKPAPAHADGFGQTLARIGDVDGDGVGDFAAGAPDSDENGSAAGSVRVHSGANGSLLLTLLGDAASARFGSSLDGIGDFDGDGVPDLVVGAGGAGLVTVHSGSDGAVLLTIAAASTAVAGLGDLNLDGVPEVGVGNGTFNTSRVAVYSGATGALLREHTAPNQDSLGASLAGIGDVNMDSFPDYIAGAPVNGCAPAGTATSYATIYSGRNGSVLFHFTAHSCDDFGTSVADAGDVNGDGWPDVIVGAPAKTAESTLMQPGFARVYSGKDGSVLHHFVGEPPGLNHLGSLGAEQFGESVAGAGDVNGDGVPDLLVGVPFKGSNPITTLGAVRVYSGAFGTLLYELTGAAPGAWLGRSVAGLGDLNGDGFADFGAGAPMESVGGIKSGKVVVWSGVP